MNIVSGSGRLMGRLALSLGLIGSFSVQLVMVAESNRPTAVLAAQQPASDSHDRRDNQKSQESPDKGLSRPRRAEVQTDVHQIASAGGPIIRVALMTDVSSVALSSSSGLIVRPAPTGLAGSASEVLPQGVHHAVPPATYG